ncbi:hypothetical protein GCM10027175_40890 [Hymenobacter latericoloratus]
MGTVGEGAVLVVKKSERNVLVVVDNFVFTNPVERGHADVAIGVKTKIREGQEGAESAGGKFAVVRPAAFRLN